MIIRESSINISFKKRIEALSKKYREKKIVIYDAGLLFSVIKENYDLNELDIIGVSDLKFDIDEDGSDYLGYKTINPYNLESKDIDVILIANWQPKPIKEFLEEDIFIDKPKIKIEAFFKIGLNCFVPESFCFPDRIDCAV